MKCIKFCLLILCSSVLLIACTPPTSQLMGPVQYKQPVTFSSNKSALIYWDYGKIIPAEIPPDASSDINPAGALLNVFIQSQKEKYDRDDIMVSYGKAQQVIFLTSLRDILMQRGAFKDVNIIVKPQKPNAQQVLISLDFVKSQVIRAQDDFPISLTVHMVVKNSVKTLYDQTFTIKPDPSIWSKLFHNFKDSQQYASQMLMKKVMSVVSQLYDK